MSLTCGYAKQLRWRDGSALRVSGVDESEPVSIRKGCEGGANGIDQGLDDQISGMTIKSFHSPS